MKKVVDLLHNLGLSEAEIKIYIKLLELGRCSVTELAHSLGMNRVTAHFNIQSLIDIGLITHMKQGRSRELTAQPPEALQYLIDQKDRQMKEIHEEFTSALPVLSALMPTVGPDRSKFDLKFYRGVTGVRSVYHEVLKAKELRSYVNTKNTFDIFPENPKLFLEAQDKNNLKMWEITDSSPESFGYIKHADPKKYFYRFFPSSWNTSVFDYMIFEGKIAMVAGKEEPNGILIVNEDMYQNAVALFEMVWKLLPVPSQEAALT